MKLCTRLVLGALVAMALSACQVEKSANPLSPAVAGPIEGVVIGAPALLEPGQDWEMKSRDQPLRLMIGNTSTNGVRPLTYGIDLATDSGFKNIIFARTGIEPGSDGTTRLQLPDKLAAGTYWWRTRAQDGANIGSYSKVQSFQVLADVVIAAPTALGPNNGSTVDDLTPTFKVRGGNRSGTTAPLEYTLQVSNNSSFSSIAATFIQNETWPDTTFDKNYSFLYSRTYYWRIRARHTAEGAGELSPWSATYTFKTPAAPVAPAPSPSPDPGSGGGGGGGGASTSACNSSSGPDIAECIEARYPSYLAAGVSLDRRRANMEFLRNKMIEHGRCKGLDLGLNLKRGGPTISSDFIVWRRPGQPDMGVDIGSAYDDTSRRLGLAWHTYSAAENYGHPYYKAYGSVSCS